MAEARERASEVAQRESAATEAAGTSDVRVGVLEERVKLADRPHFGRPLSARSNSKSFFPELADDSTETMPSPPRLIRSRS